MYVCMCMYVYVCVCMCVWHQIHELFEVKVEGEFESLNCGVPEDKISKGTAFIMAANHVLQKIHLFGEVSGTVCMYVCTVCMDSMDSMDSTQYAFYVYIVLYCMHVCIVCIYA